MNIYLFNSQLTSQLTQNKVNSVNQDIKQKHKKYAPYAIVLMHDTVYNNNKIYQALK